MNNEAGLKNLSGAERLQILALRKLTPGQRAQKAFELHGLVCMFARAGIRAQHPGFNDAQVEKELRRRLFE